MNAMKMEVPRIVQQGSVLILLISLLVACGGSETEPSPATSSESSQAPTAAATAAPPTPAPPTAMPESSDGPPLETQASGACAHPFFPLREDWAWTYRTFTDGNPSSGYTQTYADISPEGFTSLLQLDDASMESRWLCGDDGIIASDYASIAIGSMPGLSYETLEYSGVYLLPADQWVLDATWETTYKVRAIISMEGTTIESNMTIVMRNRIAAIEEITVPAGTYPEAYRIVADTTTDMSSGGFTTSMTFPVSQWFVRGVGLVKSSSTSEGVTSGIELVSLERKVE